MAFESRNILDLKEADLSELIGLTESQILEFKRDCYGEKEADKKEFLADISSFANSQGGHLLIGITAKNGIANELSGIDGSSDDLILKLEQSARTALQPRISNLKFHSVPLQNGRFVIVIYIPQSFDAPHRVIYQGKNAFWARGAGGKYEPDVMELRSMFMKTISIADRIREFHKERLNIIRKGQAPVNFDYAPSLILHIFPISALSNANSINMETLYAKWESFMPAGRFYVADRRINLDGIVVFTGQEPVEAYSQIWRNGIIETSMHLLVKPDSQNNSYTHADYIEFPLIRSIDSQLKALDATGIKGPFAINASLSFLRDISLQYKRQFHYGRIPIKFDRDPIHLPEIMITQLPANELELGTLCRNMCDAIFHAAGMLKSPNFDDLGNYIGSE